VEYYRTRSKTVLLFFFEKSKKINRLRLSALPLPYTGTAEPCSKRLSGVTGALYRRPSYAQDHF